MAASPRHLSPLSILPRSPSHPPLLLRILPLQSPSHAINSPPDAAMSLKAAPALEPPAFGPVEQAAVAPPPPESSRGVHGDVGAGEDGANGGAGASERRASRFRRICVYCGSAIGRKASYQDAAVELGKELVERGIDLVYGGGSIGLMGVVSHAVHAGGRHVLGIIPKSLMPREVTGDPIGEVIPVDDMHERKAEMVRFADAFIALPGGYGTLEELLEVITWAQLGIHKKPVGLLNVDGFYDFFLSFIDSSVREGFITEEARRIIISAPTVKELVMKLEDYVPEYNIGLVWDDQSQKQNLVPELDTAITS